MKKFSIIIPMYNVEKYIDKCITSVLNQTYKNYEIIVIDDESKDKSIEHASKYDVKLIKSKHKGLSGVRNDACKVATGEYLIFLDSDDWWDKDLLKELNESSKNNPDLIRFQMRTVTDKNEKQDYEEISFENKTGVEAFETITKFHFVDAACCYAIKRNYYEKNHFSFAKGRVHEDYGLMPLIIIKAQIVNCINYIGYNYFQRTESIMNNPDYDWMMKKTDDCYFHYFNLIKEIDKTKLDSKIFKSYVSNMLILKICTLNNKDYKEYLKKLRENKVFDNILDNTLARKIKKQLLKISPKMYYKIMK